MTHQPTISQTAFQDKPYSMICQTTVNFDYGDEDSEFPITVTYVKSYLRGYRYIMTGFSTPSELTEEYVADFIKWADENAFCIDDEVMAQLEEVA